MGRFEDVRAALRDDELFASDHGVAVNPIGNLAKLEMGSLLRALITRVETIETVAGPPRIRNNTVQGIASLPTRLS